MARLPRLCLPDIPQHIIQRRTNRQACFASNEDYTAYVHLLNNPINVQVLYGKDVLNPVWLRQRIIY
ncbi:hypothetical protein [Neptunomonas qingdaonensis]|uniref:Putative transposase n=1 Tax=Neptunomonas qingdaonensis TaxID=1045558 RepID=A0A1I2VRN4_9GAMM|nr:hypothetical protein [Neptunomonas qingdaonensis]SFG92005.1 putative transposase [Neptunomonas qingdaonensis]